MMMTTAEIKNYYDDKLIVFELQARGIKNYPRKGKAEFLMKQGGLLANLGRHRKTITGGNGTQADFFAVVQAYQQAYMKSEKTRRDEQLKEGWARAVQLYLDRCTKTVVKDYEAALKKEKNNQNAVHKKCARELFCLTGLSQMLDAAIKKGDPEWLLFVLSDDQQEIYKGGAETLLEVVVPNALTRVGELYNKPASYNVNGVAKDGYDKHSIQHRESDIAHQKEEDKEYKKKIEKLKKGIICDASNIGVDFQLSWYIPRFSPDDAEYKKLIQFSKDLKELEAAKKSRDGIYSDGIPNGVYIYAKKLRIKAASVKLLNQICTKYSEASESAKAPMPSTAESRPIRVLGSEDASFIDSSDSSEKNNEVDKGIKVGDSGEKNNKFNMGIEADSSEKKEAENLNESGMKELPLVFNSQFSDDKHKKQVSAIRDTGRNPEGTVHKTVERKDSKNLEPESIRSGEGVTPWSCKLLAQCCKPCMGDIDADEAGPEPDVDAQNSGKRQGMSFKQLDNRYTQNAKAKKTEMKFESDDGNVSCWSGWFTSVKKTFGF